MKHVKLIIICILMGICNMVNAQQDIPSIQELSITPKSPNVASMFNMVDCPVSYFNGTAEISIPLCQVEACGIKIPIAISYASTGLKPSQEAAWVGLGWNLNLNSSINRSVKCYDDFLEYSDYANSNTKYNGYYDTHNYTRDDYFALYEHGYGLGPELVRDSEPDIFCVSLWNGGNKFVFNKDTVNNKIDVIFTDKSKGWKIKVIEFQDTDYRIKHYFEITDNDGSVYEFRNYEQTYTYGRKQRARYETVGTALTPISHYNSSWYLTKIKPANSNDSIEIEYDNENYYSPIQESCYRYNWISNNPPFVWSSSSSSFWSYWYEKIPVEYVQDTRDLGENPSYFSSWTHTKSKRIKEIRWRDGKICFYSSPREDMYYHNTMSTDSLYYMKKLDEIKVFNAIGDVVYDYNFNYTYFSGGGNNENYLTKRLKLDSIVDALDPSVKYTFDYYDGSFPSKQTTSLDYWGYYNGTNYGDNYYCHSKVFDTPAPDVYNGVFKYSNYDMTILGQLKSITYPTGGSEIFEYELNSFNSTLWNTQGGELWNTYQNIWASTMPNAPYNNYSRTIVLTTETKLVLSGTLGANHNNPYGMQDLLLTVQNGNNQVIKSIYLPQDKMQSTYPIYLKDSMVLSPGTYQIVAYRPTHAGWHSEWTIKGYNPAPITYVRTNGTMSGAGLRVKTITEGDKVRHFTYSNGKMIIQPLIGYKKLYVAPQQETGLAYSVNFIQTSQSIRPLSSMSNGYTLGYANVIEKIGDVETKYTFRLRDYQEAAFSSDPSQMTYPFFENGLMTHKEIPGLYNEHITYFYANAPAIDAFALGSGSVYDLGYYGIKWWRPSSRSITTNGVNVSENYTYNNDLMIKSVNRASSGSNSTDSVSYSYEGSDSICLEMKNRNIIVPTESSKYINGNLASKTKMTYSAYGQMILPGKIENYDIDRNTYVGNTTYDRYDSHGNLLQMTHDGTPVSYIWSYNYKYPIAEISNLTYTEVENFVGSANLTSIANANEPSAAQWNLVKNLQNSLWEHSLCSSMTIYIYKPLVGITSQIAPNGLVTCYEYDASGRLVRSYIKTATGTAQDLNKYYYNYKGTN